MRFYTLLMLSALAVMLVTAELSSRQEDYIIRQIIDSYDRRQSDKRARQVAMDFPETSK